MSFVPSSLIRKAAARLQRNTSSNRLPKTPQQSWHQGTLTAVDANTNTAHFQHNGSDVVIPGVRYMIAYTPDNPPQAGDVVWLQMHGPDPLIMGRHVVPTNSVTFTF